MSSLRAVSRFIPKYAVHWKMQIANMPSIIIMHNDECTDFDDVNDSLLTNDKVHVASRERYIAR